MVQNNCELSGGRILWVGNDGYIFVRRIYGVLNDAVSGKLTLFVDGCKQPDLELEKGFVLVRNIFD
jgi:hypothetical protein